MSLSVKQVSELEDEVQSLRAFNSTIKDKYTSTQIENNTLKAELHWCKTQLFGSKKESLPKPVPENQLLLFDKKLSKSYINADIVIEDPAVKSESDVPKSPPFIEDPAKTTGSNAKKPNGRRVISSKLEVEEEIIPVENSKKVDAQGEKLSLLGFDTYECLCRIPGKVIKKIFKRERWGYKDSREVVVTANALPSIVKRGKYSDSFAHETVFQKFYMGLPLYRQMGELNMGGADIPKSSLSDIIKNFSHFYYPISEAIRASILKSPFVHMDETPLLQKTQKGKRLGFLWALKDEYQVYYYYSPSRSAQVAKSFFVRPDSSGKTLEKEPPDQGDLVYVEYLMTDGYAAYDQVAKLINATRMNCWAHSRRKFFTISHSNDEAKEIVILIDDLYRIERDVHYQSLIDGWPYSKLVDERFERRQRLSKQKIDDIEKRLHEIQVYTAPKSSFGKACSYCIKNLKAQRVYLRDGRLPIDNNSIERAIRPIAVGRKNYMFVGSEDAGQWAAICYTIMENCRMNKMDPRKYMAYVTNQIHEQGQDNVDYSSLTPYAIYQQNILT